MQMFGDLDDWSIVVFENVLLRAQDEQDVCRKLRTFLERCQRHNVFLKMSKSWFASRRSTYLDTRSSMISARWMRIVSRPSWSSGCLPSRKIADALNHLPVRANTGSQSENGEGPWTGDESPPQKYSILFRTLEVTRKTECHRRPDRSHFTIPRLMKRGAAFLREMARIVTSIFFFIVCRDVESPGLKGGVFNPKTLESALGSDRGRLGSPSYRVDSEDFDLI